MSEHAQSQRSAAVGEPLHLDIEHRQKLVAIAALRATSLDVVLNEIIDRAFASVNRQARLQAVERIAGLNLETVPDLRILARDLDDAHALPDLP